MMTSQQPSSAALPAKQRPPTTPTIGTSPLSRANRAKASVSRPVTAAAVGVPGTAPPALGEEDDGRRSRSITPNSRSFFRWFIWPWVPASTV